MVLDHSTEIKDNWRNILNTTPESPELHFVSVSISKRICLQIEIDLFGRDQATESRKLVHEIANFIATSLYAHIITLIISNVQERSL